MSKSKTIHTQQKGWMWVSLALFVLLAGVTVFAFTKEGGNTVAATVNGVKIKKDTLFDEMMRQGASQLLDNLIDKELVRQEVDKAGLNVTDADMDQEIAILKKNFSSDDEFNMMLMQYGMTMDDLRGELLMQVQLKMLLGPKTTITDEDLTKYYQDNKDRLSTPEQVKASHILVATKEEAEAILSQLKSGADFAALAKEKSTDPGSKDAGGDLNFFPRGSMAAEFEDAAFKLGVGELSGVVQTSFGYHIIKVTDKKAATTPTFGEKKEDIRNSVLMQKVQELSYEWMEEVKGKSTIVTKL